MNISPQSDVLTNTVFIPTSEEKSSWNSLQINTDINF